MCSAVSRAELRGGAGFGQLDGPCLPDGSCLRDFLTCSSGVCVCAPRYYELDLTCGECSREHNARFL